MAERGYVSPSLKSGRLSKEHEVHSKACNSFESKRNSCTTTGAVGALESAHIWRSKYIRGHCQQQRIGPTEQQIQI